MFFERFQSVFKELYVFRYIFVEGIRRAERFAFVIQQNVERLCVGSELTALEITPFIADCFQFADFAMFFDFDRMRQFSLVLRKMLENEKLLRSLLQTSRERCDGSP